MEGVESKHTIHIWLWDEQCRHPGVTGLLHLFVLMAGVHVGEKQAPNPPESEEKHLQVFPIKKVYVNIYYETYICIIINNIEIII